MDMEEEADYHKNLTENLTKELDLRNHKISELDAIIQKDEPEKKAILERKLKEKEDELQREIENQRKL